MVSVVLLRGTSTLQPGPLHGVAVLFLYNADVRPILILVVLGFAAEMQQESASSGLTKERGLVKDR